MKIDNNNKMFVISLGGSMVITEEIDVNFLKSFKELIEDRISNGHRFIITVGGGKIARKYQAAARELLEITDNDKDWLGIYATKLNAVLVKTIFKQYAHPEINQNPEDVKEFIDADYSVIVASGWKPGWSTDYIAVKLAREFGIKKIVNLSNIDYVYTKDPRKFDDAEKIENINWGEFRRIVGDEWVPGMNAPFDPIASKIAEEEEITVSIINGGKLDILKDFFDEKEFKGTVIHP